jgi:hypothetical protein
MSAVKLSDRKIVYGRRFLRTRGEWRGKWRCLRHRDPLACSVRACFRAEPSLSVARVRFYDLIMGQVYLVSEGTLLYSSRLPLLEVFAGGLRSITQSICDVSICFRTWCRVFELVGASLYLYHF